MNQIITLVTLEANRFAWIVELEHGSVLESCAIDALMEVCQKHGDYWTYYTYDKDIYAEFLNFQSGRKKLLQREFMQRYA